MKIYQTATYQIQPEGVNAVKQAITEFVAYVKANEPGTQMYTAWQQENDATKFIHFFIFENKEAQDKHGSSNEVRQFESVYRPFLVGGDVVFTNFNQVATNEK